MIASGFLLAGGQSSRMGRDKALLDLNGETLAERGLRKLRAVCADVAIAGGVPELARFARLIPDARPGCGPLGGIVAALEVTPADWNVFLAVDMPFVPVQALRRLLDCARGSEAKIVLSAVAGQLHPLCGVYPKTAMPILRRELEAGRFKVRDAVQAAGSVELLQFKDAAWFRNLNTPEEFRAVQNNEVDRLKE